jgi:hypothetical protein
MTEEEEMKGGSDADPAFIFSPGPEDIVRPACSAGKTVDHMPRNTMTESGRIDKPSGVENVSFLASSKIEPHLTRTPQSIIIKCLTEHDCLQHRFQSVKPSPSRDRGQ